MKARIIKNIKRPSSHIIEKIKKVPSSIISDCLNRYSAMTAEIKPLWEGIRICGPAITIQSMAGNNLMSHLALDFVQPGDVLVVDARGYLGNAVWGGVQTACAIKRGVAGLVVDGAIRDAEEIRKAKFPVYCKGITPAGPHKGWTDSINVPIQCGGIPVSPGDLIIGDDDGISAIPFDKIEQVYRESIERINKEKIWMEKIAAGIGSLDAVELRDIINQMDIEYLDE